MTELMVVVAIMAILSAILLPALNKGKSRSQAINCLNNLRQLQLGWQMYSDENEGQLVLNNYIEPQKLGGFGSGSGASWCPGNARTDTSFDNVQKGLLFPFNRNPKIYRCPADDSRVQAFTGGDPMLRTRSYSMSASIGCDLTGFPTFRKASEILNPPPSRLFVFIDAHEDEILDANFTLYPDRSGSPKAWIDIPSERHDRAGNLSFADGHMERWQWAAPKRFEKWSQPAASMEDLSDLRRLQGAMRQQ